MEQPTRYGGESLIVFARAEDIVPTYECASCGNRGTFNEVADDNETCRKCGELRAPFDPLGCNYEVVCPDCPEEHDGCDFADCCASTVELGVCRACNGPATVRLRAAAA